MVLRNVYRSFVLQHPHAGDLSSNGPLFFRGHVSEFCKFYILETQIYYESLRISLIHSVSVSQVTLMKPLPKRQTLNDP